MKQLDDDFTRILNEICNEIGVEKPPQNLLKADAYSLLADVRAILHNMYDSSLPKADGTFTDYDKGYCKACRDILQKVSEHFS